MPPHNLAPRPPSGYNAARDLPSQQGSIGTYIIKPGCDIQVKKPSWEGKETVFRIYPALDRAAPAERFEPYRHNPGSDATLSDVLRRYDVAWSVGNPAATFILHDPADQDTLYDKWQTPLGILYRSISQACKSNAGHPEWYPLLQGATGKSAALTPPKEAWFVQGSMIKHADKLTARDGRMPMGWPPNPPLLIMLSQQAGKKLKDMLDQENEGVELAPPQGPEEYDAYFKARYKYGDVVGVNAGKFVHIFEKGHDPRDRYQAHPTIRSSQSPFGAAGGPSVGRSSSSQDDEFRGYDLFFSDDAGLGFPATLNQPHQLEAVRKQWRWWEDFILILDYRAQAHLLFRLFPPSACFYAFDSVDKTWVPDGIRDKLANAVSASVPGQVPGQYAHGPAQPLPGAVPNPFQHPPQQAAVPRAPASPPVGHPFGVPPGAAAAPAAGQGPPPPTGTHSPFGLPGAVTDSVVPTADLLGAAPSGPLPTEDNLQKTAEAVAALAASRAKSRQGQPTDPPGEPGQPAAL